MSPTQQQDAAWRYWKARALGARGQAAEARALLEFLAYDVSFYGLLASEETGITANPKSDPVLPTPSELADLDSLPLGAADAEVLSARTCAPKRCANGSGPYATSMTASG